MDQSTKQRIVGILVILIAASALLPSLFDGQGSYQMPLESRIPEPVAFPTPPTVIAERPVITADTDTIRIAESTPAGVTEPELVPDTTVAPEIEQPLSEPAVEQPDTSQVAAVAPQQATVAATDAPGLDSVGLPEGWSVRLASFSSYPNALNLVDRLQSRGHPAYIREIPSAQGILTAVFVGPGVDRASVQQLQQQLLEEFQLSGIIVRYEIEDL
ncbi:MAG: hypothetical protein A3H44_14925 [Gammaproteobacteria bacterium RIFCSPLOWO2_02_FULL_57_10]|nr:MAG: hypothetical protein A3H44_14925 [Gammaproteobacteria bacterium RIFCSPLOWO2_02_FULL_57_10]